MTQTDFAAYCYIAPATTRKGYIAYTGRWTERFLNIRAIGVTGITGTFDDGDNDNFILGEAFTGVKGNGAGNGGDPFSGKIIKADTINNQISVFLEGSSLVSGDVDGATISGDSSAASATGTAAGYEAPSSIKHFRSDTNDGVTPPDPDLRLNMLLTSNQYIFDYYSSIYGRRDDRPSALGPSGTDLQDWMMTYDYSGADYTIASRNGGTYNSEIHSNPDGVVFSNVQNDMHHVFICADWAGGTNTNGHLRGLLSSVSHDDELAIVLIGDNAILDNCTRTHIARSEGGTLSIHSSRS